MKKTNKKRIFAWLLSLVMVLNSFSLPMITYADNTESSSESAARKTAESATEAVSEAQARNTTDDEETASTQSETPDSVTDETMDTGLETDKTADNEPGKPDPENEETKDSQIAESEENEPVTRNPRANAGTYELSWLTTASDTLTVTHTSNSEQSVALQIDFSLEEGTSAAEKEIEIRLPASIISGRDGSAVDTYQVPLPTDGGSYNYYIDEATNEIVIYNMATVTSSDTFSCQIKYSYTPYQVDSSDSVNGSKSTYINDTIDAVFTIKGDELGDPDTLTLNVVTQVKAGTITKGATGSYEAWQSAWGEVPAGIDTSKYFYVVWEIYYRTTTACTQPYTAVIEDNILTGEADGAFLVGSSTSSSITEANFTAEDIAPVYYDLTGIQTTNYFYRYAVVAYPRTLYQSTGADSVEVQNSATVTVEGDDGAEDSTTTTAASYTYSSIRYQYDGDAFSLTKLNPSSYIGLSGPINGIENDQAVSLSGTYNYSYSMTTTSKGYALTKDANGEYGKKEYTVEMIDDLMYLNNIQLQPTDYSITSFYLSGFYEYDATENVSTGELTHEQNKDYDSYTPIDVLYTTDGTNWSSIGKISRKTSSFIYTANDGSQKTINSGNQVSLPVGTCGVKFTHTSTKYRVDMSAYISVELNPTTNIKDLMADQSSVSLNNVNSLIIWDSEGKIRNDASGSLVEDISSTLAGLIKDRDESLYGQEVQHNSETLALKRLSSSTNTEKSLKSTENNPNAKQAELTYQLEVYEVGMYNESYFTDEEVKALDGFVNEQTKGVFYDLLPAGAIADTSSISVITRGTSLDCSYTVETVDNWQGSGQTMLIIAVEAPVEGNYSILNAYTYKLLSSGFTVTYTLVYPWQSITDYSNTVLNTFAYRSSTDTLSSGKTAAESGIKNAAYYSNLSDSSGQSQTTDDTEKNTVYKEISSTINVVMSSETGFTKRVKAADGISYAVTDEAPASGTYTYQLRYATGEEQTAKDILLYDVLESSYGTNSYWQGTLESIDTTYAEGLGIAPVIYYSTASGLNPSAVPDLTNGAIWSSVKPSDLSTVTAIAIDLSTNSSGGDYVLQSSKAVFCNIKMRATADFENEADKLAYNTGYCQVTTTLLTGGSSLTTVLDSSTTVSLRAADVTIDKTADPGSGTEEMPTVVSAGGNIDYTISVTNTNTAEAMTDVEVSDTIPAGLVIDEANIKYYFGANAPQLVSGSSQVSLTPSGQTLVFSIDKLAAGETINLVIPTTVPSNVISYTQYKNTAMITKINGMEYEVHSDPTYHEVIVPVEGYTVTVNKKSDPASGTEVKADEVIKYTLTVENTGVVTAPYVIVKDEIPEGTAYVSGSATQGGVLKDGGSYIEWLIEDLKPGAEIEVSFTVIVDENPPTYITNVGLYGSGDTSEDLTADRETNVITHTTDDEEYPVNAVIDVIKRAEPTPGSAISSGSSITYYLDITNTGGITARDIYVKDYIPETTTYTAGSAEETAGAYQAGSASYVEWKIAELEAGETITVSFSVTVDDPNNGRVIENQALYEKDWDGSKTEEPENTTNIVQHPVKVPAVEGYQVTVNKRADVPSTTVVNEGDTLTYTLNVKNTGAQAASYTIVKDEIPEGTTYVSATAGGTFVPANGSEKAYVYWLVTDLEPNNSLDLSFAVTINADPPAFIINAALYGTGDNQEQITPEEPTNQITHTTDPESPVAAILDTIKKTNPDPGTEVKAGDEITYTMEVTNTGGTTAYDVYVRDYIPEGTSFKSVNDGGNLNGTYVEWFIDEVKAGETKSVSFIVTVDGPNVGRIIKNQALYEDNWDPENPEDPENKTNIPELETPIDEGVPTKKVAAGSSAGQNGESVVIGDEITYEITYTNDTKKTAKITIIDTLDQGVDFVAAEKGGSYDESTHSVKWEIEEVPTLASGSVQVTVRVTERAKEQVTNMANVQIGSDPERTTNEVTNPLLTQCYLLKVNKAGEALQGAKFTVVDADNNVTTLETGEDGKAALNLPEGTYVLTEIKTPNGYKLYAPKVTFTITSEYKIELGADTSADLSVANNGLELRFVNVKLGDSYIYEDEDTETEETEESTESEETTDSGSGGTGRTTSKGGITQITKSSPKTGDDTPVVQYLGILLLALVVIGGVVLKKRRADMK